MGDGLILLKTSGSTLGRVVEYNKHALSGRISAVRGELILISETESTLRPNRLPVRHVMEFRRCYPDSQGESQRIWGRRWRYIVEGAIAVGLGDLFG